MLLFKSVYNKIQLNLQYEQQHINYLQLSK